MPYIRTFRRRDSTRVSACHALGPRCGQPGDKDAFGNYLSSKGAGYCSFDIMSGKPVFSGGMKITSLCLWSSCSDRHLFRSKSGFGDSAFREAVRRLG